jgi:hypothetical protein
LVAGNVEALDTTGAGLKGTGISGGSQQEGESCSLDSRSHGEVRVREDREWELRIDGQNLEGVSVGVWSRWFKIVEAKSLIYVD